MASYKDPNSGININIPGFISNPVAQPAAKPPIGAGIAKAFPPPVSPIKPTVGNATIGGIASLAPKPPVRPPKDNTIVPGSSNTTNTSVTDQTTTTPTVTQNNVPAITDTAPTKSYDYDKLEDIYGDKSLTGYQRRRYLAQYYQKRGLEFDPNNFPETFEDATMDFLGQQKEQKSLLDKQIEYEKQQGQKNLEQNMSALSSRFSQGREGPQSASNPMVTKQVTGSMVSQFQNAMDRLQQQKIQLAQMQADQQNQWVKGRDDQIMQFQASIAEQESKLAAEETKRQENSQTILNLLAKDNNLAGLSQEDIDYLQKNLPGIPSGVLAVLANTADKNRQIEEQKRLSESGQQKFDNQQKSLGTFTSLVNSGVVLNDKALMQMSELTGLPLEALISFNDQAQLIQQDKSLDQATKTVSLQKLQDDLQRQQRGIIGEQLQKLDYVNNQVQEWQAQGMSQSDIMANRQELLQNLGIKSTDDPLYQIDIQKGLLQNQALNIANKYLPQEKVAELNSKLLSNEAQRISNQYLPQEKQIQLQNDFYDSVIKEAQANNAPDTEVQKLKLLKAQAAEQTAKVNEMLGIVPTVNVPTKSKYPVTVNPDGSISFDTSSINQSIQCGRFVNDVIGIPGFMSDSYESKLARTDPGREPHVGDFFVMPVTGKSAPYGHTGIVTKVNADGTINLAEANWHNDGAFGTRDNVNIKGMSFGANPNMEQQGGSKADKPALLSVPKELRTEVTQKANQFDGEQQVKNFQQVQAGYSFAKNISDNSTNPADDIGLIYAFAKVMDPNSVVREGEYNTVQKYAQTWADTFGFQANRLFSNTNFLTPQARKNLKATLLSKYNNEKGQYDNVRKQYVKSIDALAGKNVGESILQDYSTDEGGNDLNSYLDSVSSQSNDPYQEYLNSLQ